MDFPLQTYKPNIFGIPHLWKPPIYNFRLNAQWTKAVLGIGFHWVPSEGPLQQAYSQQTDSWHDTYIYIHDILWMVVKTCTILDGWHPINGKNQLSTGAGFLPSACSSTLWDHPWDFRTSSAIHMRSPSVMGSIPKYLKPWQKKLANWRTPTP